MTLKTWLDSVKDPYSLRKIFKPEVLKEVPVYRVEFGQGYPTDGNYSWSSMECFSTLSEAKTYVQSLKDQDISFFRIKTSTTKDFDPDLLDKPAWSLLREDLTELDWACFLLKYRGNKEELTTLTELWMLAMVRKYELSVY